MKDQAPSSSSSPPFRSPWAVDADEVLQDLSVPADYGLDSSEAATRLDRFGPNRLRASHRTAAWTILVDQFKNLIILLLGAAAALSFAFGKWLEGVSILIAVVLNAGIGFFTEWRAVRSMEALERLGHTSARTLRDGQVQSIDSDHVVPGDIIVVDAGDVVPADVRLMESSGLKVDESSLSGESEPVAKQVEPVGREAELSERFNMLFRGSAVTGGSGRGVVVTTGMNTELGRIAAMAKGAGEDNTPLERRLDLLGRRLVWVTLAITAVVALSGVVVGKDPLLVIETAIALAVAAIPEGLPIVATIALARGMWRMADRNALINRLSAVETLGSATVICTDKTGTLTENRLTLQRLSLPATGSEGARKVTLEEGKTSPASIGQDQLAKELLKTGALCIEAVQHSSMRKGDPLEKALMTKAADAGIRRSTLLEAMPLEREVPFDRSVRMMAVYNEQEDGRYRVSIKGAPEAVLDQCSWILTPEGPREMDQETLDLWKRENDRMAAEEGLRVLAGAMKTVDDAQTDPYDALIFQGLFGLLDPPRAGVRESVKACHRAGMRVVMVTGDQPMTAKSIGLSLGLVSEDDVPVIHGKQVGQEGNGENRELVLRAPLLARVSPRQKLDLVTIHQEAGEVVAMTGDGVNDAPALKKADIGIAMGKRGTQVARQAADMILKDDAFFSIVAAVEQGRTIFHNIRKFILYLLSGNVSEIMIVTAALLVGATLPLLPLQILYLNLIGDVFPALALGLGAGDASLMNSPPRDPKEAVLARRHWAFIVWSAGVMAGSVLGAFALSFAWLDADRSMAVTIAFLTLAFARLWHVFNMRDKGSPPLKNDVVRNPYVWGALALCSVLLLAGVYVPGLSLVLQLDIPDARTWGLIMGMSLVPLAVLQVYKGRLFSKGKEQGAE